MSNLEISTSTLPETYDVVSDDHLNTARTETKGKLENVLDVDLRDLLLELGDPYRVVPLKEIECEGIIPGDTKELIDGRWKCIRVFENAMLDDGSEMAYLDESFGENWRFMSGVTCHSPAKGLVFAKQR